MLATYHNHTTWSDGKHSVAALIGQAALHGIAELGIADHYVLPPKGKQPRWSMTHEELPRYVEEILSRVEGAASQGVTLRLGLEVDWFPGHAEAIEEALALYPFDFLVGSVHQIDDFTIDSSSAPWKKCSPVQIDEVHRNYWVNIKSLAQSKLFDIVAHIDLPKKFGYPPHHKPEAEIEAALDAIAEAGSVVELNTAGWHKPCADAYPTLDILKACHRRGIPTTLSADAHDAQHLVRDFDRGAQRLYEAGYREIARFAQRRRTLEPLTNPG
ncbi:MAG: histidinol-phosphatase HisJ family protein [Planctomycetota bacterium]|nr:histidinol-phosphatase HisJ family protein [Planctomycetota bacterium]